MDLSALTIQQLRYVVAVDDHRSFREAALHCHVSQPALSSQVKKVEDVLGTSIFDRARQPVMLTDRGIAVVAQARVVLQELDRFRLLLSRHEDLSGPYRLGIIPTLVPALLPLVAGRFAAGHPRVALEIEETKTDVLVRRLREGSLDAGLAATPLHVPSLHERVICHEPFQVYLSPQHPLTARTSIRQESLAEERPWLLSEGHCFRTQVLSLCRDKQAGNGSCCSVQYDGGSLEALIRLVDAGVGVTVLPELVVRQLPPERRAAQVRPFAPPQPVREVSFIVAREHVRGDIADALYTAVRDALPQELRGRKPAAAAVLEPLAEQPAGAHAATGAKVSTGVNIPAGARSRRRQLVPDRVRARP